MKIEIGEYVRTKDGYIGKLVEYIPEALNYLKIDIGREIKHSDDTVDNFIYTRYGFQLKHSKNIIDLIELGDLVEFFVGYNLDKEDTNLFEVIAIAKKTNEIGVFRNNLELDFFPIDNLIAITTREQFENSKYKIEELEDKLNE